MKRFAAVLLFVASLSWGQEQDSSKFIHLLRDKCVAVERTLVAEDTQDFSHLKDTDWQSAGFCEGFIQGWWSLTGNQSAVRIAVVYPDPDLKTTGKLYPKIIIPKEGVTIRQQARALVRYIDEHSAEAHLNVLVFNALYEYMLLTPLVGVPDCPPMPWPKDFNLAKAFPDGCNLATGPAR
jgi:hypothetical protein